MFYYYIYFSVLVFGSDIFSFFFQLVILVLRNLENLKYYLGN